MVRGRPASQGYSSASGATSRSALQAGTLPLGQSSQSTGRDFPRLYPDHHATAPQPKQSWLYVPTLTQRRGWGSPDTCSLLCLPTPRLASPLRVEREQGRVLEERKGGRVRAQITAPSSPIGQSHGHTWCPHTSLPTGKNPNPSVPPARSEASGSMGK